MLWRVACWQNRSIGDRKDADSFQHAIADPARAAEATSAKVSWANGYF
ncbi:MAG: hypothetical protein JRE72_07720 [Deltaproteobacteria bacterium]|jgi:hypothetical protein|nr:hypothetical protein [Deltaproteobacteria bacterium]